jgi:hypothetical protein
MAAVAVALHEAGAASLTAMRMRVEPPTSAVIDAMDEIAHEALGSGGYTEWLTRVLTALGTGAESGPDLARDDSVALQTMPISRSWQMKSPSLRSTSDRICDAAVHIESHDSPSRLYLSEGQFTTISTCLSVPVMPSVSHVCLPARCTPNMPINAMSRYAESTLMCVLYTDAVGGVLLQ